MKKKFLVIFLAVIMCFVLVGCANNNTNNDTPVPTDSLPVVEVKEDELPDLPLGLETNYLTVNGNDIVIRLQTSGSSKHQSNGPYYINYNIYVGNDTIGYGFVREGRYHLEGYGITMLKEYDIEAEDGHNYEFFEWDFTSSVIKGADKEYVAISIPAGLDDKNQSSLIICTDDGKLLADFIADVEHDVTLTGPDIDKYKNHSGDFVFNSIKDGIITYLTPTEAMYIVDENGNKVLNSSLSEIELEEHSITMSDNKTTDTVTGNVYKITNPTGKTFNFGNVRHL